MYGNEGDCNTGLNECINAGKYSTYLNGALVIQYYTNVLGSNTVQN